MGGFSMKSPVNTGVSKNLRPNKKLGMKAAKKLISNFKSTF